MKQMPLTIAVAKGYLWNESKDIFSKMGFEFDTEDGSRQLYALDKTGTCKILLIRPWDVPTYVEEGAADLGIVGKDVLLEQSPNVAELLDLKFGHCKLVLAGPEKLDPKQLPHNLKVATKYDNSTLRYFKEKSLQMTPIKLYGAIELAPLTQIADLICDLTATGSTLKAHELEIIDTLFESTARLIANTASLKTRYNDIVTFSDAIQKAC